MTRRSVTLLAALATLASACATSSDAAVPVPGGDTDAAPTVVVTGGDTAADTSIPDEGGAPAVGDTSEPTTAATDPDPATASATTTTAPPAADPTTSTSSTTSSTTSTTTTSTTTTSTTTTTTVPPLDVYDPACVVEVSEGESLGLIADRFDDETVDPETLIAENDLSGEQIQPGWLIDVCVDNGLDDIDGEERVERNSAVVARAVRQQQKKLNQLFAGLGIRELLVDGISGPVTRQRICAARVALGLPVTLTDLEPGSDEEQTIMAAAELPTPFTTAVLSDRWVLIDMTCQIMFVGSRGDTTYVFPTSTGEAGHETRLQDRSPAFRYDPASDNGGWHNSTTFPVAIDNPLNGNMYKPIYFDGGQAIHGANNVPRSPQSKGCARLRVDHQNLLVDWLGLGGRSSPTWSSGEIGLTVNVQGSYPGG